MKKGEIYEGIIEKVDFPNKGYVQVDDQKVLIKNVLVIGGGDTGNDCQGTALRQGCTDLMALEMMPQSPKSVPPTTPGRSGPRCSR